VKLSAENFPVKINWRVAGSRCGQNNSRTKSEMKKVILMLTFGLALTTALLSAQTIGSQVQPLSVEPATNDISGAADDEAAAGLMDKPEQNVCDEI
jgi:hypothetical protein